MTITMKKMLCMLALMSVFQMHSMDFKGSQKKSCFATCGVMRNKNEEDISKPCDEMLTLLRRCKENNIREVTYLSMLIKGNSTCQILMGNRSSCQEIIKKMEEAQSRCN